MPHLTNVGDSGSSSSFHLFPQAVRFTCISTAENEYDGIDRCRCSMLWKRWCSQLFCSAHMMVICDWYESFVFIFLSQVFLTERNSLNFRNVLLLQIETIHLLFKIKIQQKQNITSNCILTDGLHESLSGVLGKVFSLTFSKLFSWSLFVVFFPKKY